MEFDAYDLATGWLSVALASSKDPDRPAFNRTISIEQYPTGVRLVATDSYILLRSWVPSNEDRFAAEPDIDEAPTVGAVAIDVDGRGKGLLGYLLGKARRARADEISPVLVTMQLGVVVEEDEHRPSFAGLAAHWVTFDHDGVERLRLRAYEGEYPNWRALLAHFDHEETKAVALNPDILGRVAKLGTYHQGPLLWHFGGYDKVARLEVEHSAPVVEGLVMPVRSQAAEDANKKPDLVSELFWQIIGDIEPPATDDEGDEGDA